MGMVFNVRARDMREVLVTPKKWGGDGVLGAVLRLDSVSEDDCQGLRVLQVFPDSPAEEAGLVPMTDYLVGTKSGMFRGINELGEMVSRHDGKSVMIYVYNSETESIREISMKPQSGWG